jgi:N-formylglutamate deformylase
MTTAVEPGIFIRHDPDLQPVPVVLDVSRSGREYPPEFRSPIPFTTLHDNVSMYVEELWASAPALGATLLFCSFPNTFIDVNRTTQDLDPAVIEGEWPSPLQPSEVALRGLGLIKTKSRYGEQLQERKLSVAEIQERLSKYYDPYHRELGRLIDERHRRFGLVRQLSCHCMSATGAPTHADKGVQRADFCIGDVHGASASREFVDLIVGTLRSYGYSVTVNDPYYGYELNSRYGAPDKGIDSVMIEINKKLFMDTATFRRTAGFAKLKADLDRLLEVVIADSLSRASARRAASRV